MIVKQLPIPLENKPGQLAEVTEVLAKGGINPSAFCVAENADFSTLRGTASDPDKAYKALKDNHFAVSVMEMVDINCPNVPDVLARVLQYPFNEGVFTEYMYSFADNNSANVIIRPSDMEDCVRALTEKKVDLPMVSDLYKL